MPKNHLSYSGLIALSSILVLAACSSSPEDQKINQIRAENHRIYGPGYDEEIDLHELARQVVFLEKERRRLIFENRLLRSELRRRRLHADRYHLLPVQIAYFEAYAKEGDEIRFTSLDHISLPQLVFYTRGPYTRRDFNQFGLFYEEPCLFLPRGRYRVEIFNGDVCRFTITKNLEVTEHPGRLTLQNDRGEKLELAPNVTTLYLHRAR